MVNGIVGREAELEAVERFLNAVRERAAALVIEGEAGMGKTTVWQEAVTTARALGFPVLLARPAESEAKLSYAALVDLLGPAYDETRAELPEPQQRALDAAALHHLIRSRLGTAPARPMLMRIAAASGGNPFFALEIVRALERDAGERALGDPLPVPERLHKLVAARVRTLTPAGQEAVLVASALSRPTVATVADALGANRDQATALVE